MSPSRDGIHGPVSRVSAVASESHTCAISSMTPTTICTAATKVWSLLLIQPQMIQPTLFGACPTGLDPSCTMPPKFPPNLRLPCGWPSSCVCSSPTTTPKPDYRTSHPSTDAQVRQVAYTTDAHRRSKRDYCTPNQPNTSPQPSFGRHLVPSVSPKSEKGLLG